MSQSVKTPKGSYALIASGFGFGALCVYALYNGATPAYAQLRGVPTRTISATSAESVAELHNLDTSYTNLADFASPAVVDIHSTNNSRKLSATGQRVPISGGEGSGFIFRENGYIITNDHVVGGYDEVKVTTKDGREYTGKVTRAEDSDIALVKIEAHNLPTLALGDSSRVRTGQTVMAVGAPFGLIQSVTFGHISALGRESNIENKLYPDLIQTDASINMGNSGGPLINIDGQVVGVNTSILSPSGASAGIGFAIPSNQVRFIAEMLIAKGKVTRSMIGLVPVNLKDYQKQEMKLSGGALVDIVSSDGAAAAAGIKKGDVIVKIAQTPITNELDLRNSMLIYAPGTTVPVELVRDGQHKTINIKLTEYKRPPAPKQDFQQFDPNFDLPKGFNLPKGFTPFKDGPGFKFPDTEGDDQPNGQEQKALPHTGPARLGVMVGDVLPETQAQYNIPSGTTGALIGTVQPGSIGAKIGLQPGDVIVKLGTAKITSAKDLTDAMAGVKWGDIRNVKYVRFAKSGMISKEQDVKFN